MKKNEDKQNVAGQLLSAAGSYIKQKYPFLILFFVGLLIVSALNFMKISTVQSIANFSINDFEIGQISDRTIIADRNLAPDDVNPIAITKGEKIIKKGFPITEEAFSKLKKMASSPLYIDYRAFANNELYLVLLAIMWYLLFSFIPFGRKIQLKEPILHVILFIIVYSVTAFCAKFSFFLEIFLQFFYH